MSQNIDTATCADIGGRDEQQDRVAVLHNGNAYLLVLADGMGGHKGGALAAQAVLDIAREELYGNLERTADGLLIAIAIGAHERINVVGAKHHISPHSTCVLLHLTENEANWAHVGDSRLYRFKRGRLIDRTVDHSVVELMRLQGRISDEEMKSHPDQNRLYEAVGGAELPNVDLDRAEVSKHDGFLLASDGLWENTLDRELEEVFAAEDLTEALEKLVVRAKARGGGACDNISVSAARFARATPSLAARVRAFLGMSSCPRTTVNAVQ